jgi:hypothetical protein
VPVALRARLTIFGVQRHCSAQRRHPLCEHTAPGACGGALPGAAHCTSLRLLPLAQFEKVIRDAARRCQEYFVTKKWMAGTLTNTTEARPPAAAHRLCGGLPHAHRLRVGG